MPKKAHNNRFEVARVLENAVLMGQFPPGARLPEMHIARELGVSQASVREALQHLEGLGLVRKYPNRGTVVIQLDSEDLVQIYQVRLELEPMACGLAASPLTLGTQGYLQDCLEAMQSAADTNNFQAFSAADVRFHRCLWAAQPNRYLERSLQTICLPLFAFDLIRRYAAPHVNFRRTIVQHQRIVTAMRSGDAPHAAAMMRRMIERWLRQDLAEYDVISEDRQKEPYSQPSSLDFLRDSLETAAPPH